MKTSKAIKILKKYYEWQLGAQIPQIKEKKINKALKKILNFETKKN